MKKVLSFVLVLSLVLSSFSMAFAGEVKTGLTDVAGVANEEAINVVNNLGIVTGYTDGTFKADKAVNRAEFAVMITKALGIPESALAGYTATNFTDIAGYEWAVPYLAFCESKGIMSGYGEGIVKPGNTITVNEAMAMALRAVGYTPNSSVLVGTWPSNYVTLAQDKGLYDDVKAVATVDRGSAAQVIYNALIVEKVQVNADGETKGLGTDMLNAGLKCHDNELGFRVVNGTENSLINLTEYLGARALLVHNEDHQVVAVREVKTTFLTVDDIEAGKYFTTADGTKYYTDGAYTTAAALFTNGYVDTATAGSIAVGDTLAVILSGKTVDTIVSVLKWGATTDDFQFEADMLDLEKGTLNANEFVLLEDDTIDYDSFTLLGAKSLESIPEDAVVYVYDYTSGNNAGKIAKIEVGTETVTGKVTKVDADGDYHINGTAYTNVGVDTINVGEEGTAALDYAGDIYDWTVTNEAKGNYAVLVATGTSIEQSSMDSSKTMVKLFTSAGEEKSLVVDTDKTTIAGLTTGKIVEFSLNKDGEVNKLTDVTTSVAINNEAVAEDGSLIGTHRVASNVVVFAYDSSEDEYTVEKMSALSDNITVSAVVIEDNLIKAFVTTNVGNTDETYGVVTAIGATGEEDGTPVELVDVIVNGKVMTDIIDRAENATTGTALKVIKIDEDGNVDSSTVASVPTAGATTVKAIDGDIITFVNGQSYKVASDVTVYVFDSAEGEWTVGKLSQAKKYVATLYDTSKEADDLYDVVIVVK